MISLFFQRHAIQEMKPFKWKFPNEKEDTLDLIGLQIQKKKKNFLGVLYGTHSNLCVYCTFRVSK